MVFVKARESERRVFSLSKIIKQTFFKFFSPSPEGSLETIWESWIGSYVHFDNLFIIRIQKLIQYVY